jgi:hypothetical protein
MFSEQDNTITIPIHKLVYSLTNNIRVDHQKVENEICLYLNCLMFNYLGSMPGSGREIFGCHDYYRLWKTVSSLGRIKPCIGGVNADRAEVIY